MTQSSLGSLNDHLFAQLNRLSDSTLKGDDLDEECRRAEAIVAVADQVTANAKTQLGAAQLFAKHGQAVLPHLPLIGNAPK